MSGTIDPTDNDDGNEPTNPFDPKGLHFAGGMSQGSMAKRILTSIPVREPPAAFQHPLAGALTPQTVGRGR